MSFVYPLGLLGLIAIPVLVIIYIIKNKYTEQVIASTYIWTLSERFLKKKNPINRLTGIISLILQILAVIFISLSVAKPVFVLKDAAEDYMFIIDASASMNLTDGEQTRYERAKGEIEKVISSASSGSTFTLINQGRSTERVFEGIDDKRMALSILSSIEPEQLSSSLTPSLSIAQQAFTSNPSLKVTVYTDKQYDTTENLTVINLASGEINYSVSNLSFERTDGGMKIKAKAWSHGEDAEISVALIVDGNDEAKQVKTYSAKKLEGCDVEFDYPTADFDSIEVRVENADGLSLDNSSILYNEKGDDSYKTLVVADQPLFFKSAITAVSSVSVETVSASEYKNVSGDYGLYVFDGFVPNELPKNSAVWFVNPDTKVNGLSGVGFTVADEVDFGNDLQNGKIENWKALEFSDSTSSVIKNLLLNLKRGEINIAGYRRTEFFRNFHELAYCDNDPIIFAGVNAYGNRQAVFSFDIHDLDFAVSYDFPVLVSNLIEYTFPDKVDGTQYYCGEKATVNVLANVDEIRVESPLGEVDFLDTSTEMVELEITEVGTYTLTFISGNVHTPVYLYGNLPMEERAVTANEDSLVIAGEAKEEKRDGKYEDLTVWFIILAAVFVADWMVYCYEQYQLR